MVWNNGLLDLEVNKELLASRPGRGSFISEWTSTSLHAIIESIRSWWRQWKISYCQVRCPNKNQIKKKCLLSAISCEPPNLKTYLLLLRTLTCTSSISLTDKVRYLQPQLTAVGNTEHREEYFLFEYNFTMSDLMLTHPYFSFKTWGWGS